MHAAANGNVDALLVEVAEAVIDVPFDIELRVLREQGFQAVGERDAADGGKGGDAQRAFDVLLLLFQHLMRAFRPGQHLQTRLIESLAGIGGGKAAGGAV